MTGIKVRVKQGCRHGRLHANHDAKIATGNPGPYAKGGDVIEVTQAELDSFGDKFELLDPVSAVLSAPNGTEPKDEQDKIDVIRLRAQLAQAEAETTKAKKATAKARAQLRAEREKASAQDEQA